MGIGFSGRIRPLGRVGVRSGSPPNVAPLWTTAAGTLGSVLERDTAAFALQATDSDGSITGYSVTTGVLPGGLSLDPATGAITGRAALVSGTALTTFTVQVADNIGATADREFGIEVIDTDPLLDETVLHMPFQGLVGSTAFTDASFWGRTLSLGGTTGLTAAQAKFGTGSVAFAGNGYAYYSNADGSFTFGTDNFTVELWFRPGTVSGTQTIFSTSPTTNYQGVSVFMVDDQVKWCYGTGSSWPISDTVGTVAANTWHHLAMVRQGTEFRLYLNGTLSHTRASVSQSLAANPQFALGGITVASQFFTGHMNDARVYRGVAKYTASFTPPSAPMPVGSDDANWSKCILACPFTSGLRDYAPRQFSTVGTVALADDDVATGFDSSVYCNGSSCILFPDSDDFWMGTGDYTFETWVSRNRTGFTELVMGQTPSNGADAGCFHLAFLPDNSLSFTDGTYCPFPSSKIADTGWHHIAVVRRGGVLRLYLDGSPDSQSYTVASSPNQSTPFAIGRGGNYGSLYFQGWLADVRLTKAARYTGSFVPAKAPVVPAVYDPDYANVSALLLMNGTNGSTTITDEKGKTVTRNGSVAISTTKAVFGQSAHFPNTNGATQASHLILPLSSDFVFGTGDFTIEYWVNHNSFASGWFGQQWHMSIWGGPGSRELLIAVTNSKLETYVKGAASLSDSLTLVANTWYHVAIARKSGTIRMYINGELRQSAANTSDLNVTTQPFAIGANLDSASNVTSGGLDGYLDSVRITKGVARYTGNAFRVPDRAFPTHD